MTMQVKIRPSEIAPSHGTSQHWPAGVAGEFIVEGTLAGNGTLGLRALHQSSPVAEAILATSDNEGEHVLTILQPDASHPADVHVIAILVEATFQRLPEASAVLLPNLAGRPGVAALATQTVADTPTGETMVRVARSHFHQLPLLWHHGEAHLAYPVIRSALGTQDRLPPLRPPQPAGTFYRRWIPDLATTLSMRVIDRRKDLALFHGWMNQPRVSFFWELAQSEAELDRYLAEQEADPHIFGVIGSLGDEPSSYFEFYWAREDRLGPHYESEDFDRGWHGLIGNPRHLGRPKTLAWFRSVTHCLFLDEPRTRRIVGEPRASHQKMLSYCADVAYDKVKEFDFPHKRAALVCCERERFFREVAL
jgi:acetyl CoA:N6-hydroxylysine acetyl transferase